MSRQVQFTLEARSAASSADKDDLESDARAAERLTFFPTRSSPSRSRCSRRELASVPREVLAAWTWRNYSPMLAFGLSIPVFFVTKYGWVLWFAVPMALARLHHVPPHLRSGRPGGPTGGRGPLRPPDPGRGDAPAP